MTGTLYVPFPWPSPADPDPVVDEVGGKGAALLRLAAAGFPVPPGVILTRAFFAPWSDRIRREPGWPDATAAEPASLAGVCDRLRASASSFAFDERQVAALAAVRTTLVAGTSGTHYAVRSSAPDEDGARASFAGVHESRLGVAPCDLEAAVRECFVASLHARVFSYRRQHGLDPEAAGLAVVVQRQVASESSGVGFSLNPISNDYDEAVFAANHGLGSTVVDGRVTPDHFVVHRVDGAIIEAVAGAKALAEWFDPEQGIVERVADAAHGVVLDDAQLRELTAMIGRIEALFGTPVDIEWAYAGGELHLLQARPITTWVPLPAELVTAPGAPRRLYADAALSKGLTTNTPISPLGLDNMKHLFSAVLSSSLGAVSLDRPIDDSLFLFAGGRMYVNYSGILRYASPAKLAGSTAPTDALMAEILAAVDRQRYRAQSRPAWFGIHLLWGVPRAFWRLRGFLWSLLRTLVAPERAHRRYGAAAGAIFAELRAELAGGLPLEQIRAVFEPRMTQEMFRIMLPALLVGLISPRLAVPARDEDANALADRLTLGVPGDVVVEMGIALHGVARMLAPEDFADLDVLAGRVERRELPAAILAAWDAFLAAYGWRGPAETDVASPRYADDPRLALRQMSYLVGEDIFDPAAAHRRLAAERREAFTRLSRRLGPLRRTALRWMCRRVELFRGTRDTPKHLIVLYGAVVRNRALTLGRHLVSSGRLDEADDVFGLSFADLAAGAEDPVLDLRALVREHTRFQRWLRRHVSVFPAVIDSRGRILRPPPRDELPGLLTGMAVSPGVVSGPVKILRTHDEKPIEPGDVLVAYTTDPGWTPLFVNAAAVILEVGGVLQHGAVVAREYDKPCVVGIDRVLDRLADGELVEVDGAAGTVRRLAIEGGCGQAGDRR